MVAPLFPATLEGALVRRQGKAILGPVDLQLNAEGFTIVLGPNGSGKTTLLRVLHGVERLSDGAAAWAIPAQEARERQSYVFQSPIMLRRSVGENLAYPLQLRKIPKAQIQTDIQHWAARTGLRNMLEQPARRLSGGEKQKLAIARALIRQPDVVFLDEPTANLDGSSTREIEALLKEAHAGGTRFIMATHDLGQARRLASDVVFLLHGKLHEAGPAPSIFQRPTTKALTAFLQGDIVE